MNREVILNNFFGKLTALQNQRAKEMRLSIKEAEEIAIVINELLTHFYSKVSSFQDSIKPGEVKVVPFSNDDVIMDGGSFK